MKVETILSRQMESFRTQNICLTEIKLIEKYQKIYRCHDILNTIENLGCEIGCTPLMDKDLMEGKWFVPFLRYSKDNIFGSRILDVTFYNEPFKSKKRAYQKLIKEFIYKLRTLETAEIYEKLNIE